MGNNTSTIDNFTLEYLDGDLYIAPFQLGKMPGTIEVSASGLTVGEKVKCEDTVILTLPTGPMNYNANITVSDENGKLKIAIEVLNPIYENLPFVAEVVFTEN